jgi:flagellar biosynthetic protein FliR
MNVTLPWADLESVLLAGVRMAAFLVIAPPFSHRGIPATVKAMLAMGLALLVSPSSDLPGDPSDVAGFVGELLMQAVIGLALGFLVAVVFGVIQSAGALLDMFAGLQVASAYDPMQQSTGAPLQRLYQLTAIVLLFASDGYQLVITGLVRTFDVLPIGTPLDTAAMAALSTEGMTQIFLAALQVAGPLAVVLFLADVGLGLLTKVAPALNAFALGFPLKIMMTLSLLGMAYVALPELVSALAEDAMRSVMGVVR